MCALVEACAISPENDVWRKGSRMRESWKNRTLGGVTLRGKRRGQASGSGGGQGKGLQKVRSEAHLESSSAGAKADLETWRTAFVPITGLHLASQELGKEGLEEKGYQMRNASLRKEKRWPEG